MSNNEVCENCDGNGLIAPPGVKEPIDCLACGGEGFVEADDDDEEE